MFIVIGTVVINPDHITYIYVEENEVRIYSIGMNYPVTLKGEEAKQFMETLLLK